MKQPGQVDKQLPLFHKFAAHTCHEQEYTQSAFGTYGPRVHTIQLLIASASCRLIILILRVHFHHLVFVSSCIRCCITSIVCLKVVGQVG